MRHPSNRGERKAARDKFRRKVTNEERYDSGRKSRENGPDFNPDNRDRKAVKARPYSDYRAEWPLVRFP